MPAGGVTRNPNGASSQRVWPTTGFTALTVGSPDDQGKAVIYVGFAIDFLSEHRFKHVVCVGASNGASGCAYNAAEPEIEGLGLLTYHGSADRSSSDVPKLFMAAELDDLYRPETEAEYARAAQPKSLVIIPSTAETGPQMLDVGGQDWHQTLIDFVKTCTAE